MKRSHPRAPGYPAEFNDWFDDAFEEAAQKLPLYTDAYKQQSWGRIQPRLKKRAKRRNRWAWLRRFEVIALIAVFVLFTAVLFTPPLVTEAVSPIYQELRNWGNGMSQIIFGNGRKAEPGSVTYAQNSANDERSLKEQLCPKAFPVSMKTQLGELRDSLPFPLPRITYLPEGYVFNSAELIPSQALVTNPEENSPAAGVYLLFESRSGEQLTMMFRTLREDEIIRMPYEENIETLTLDNGTVAYYTPGKTAQITFMIEDIYFMAAGQLGKSQLLGIANGLDI